MLLDDLRSYLQMASGLTEASAGKAKEIVSGLVAQGINLTSKATAPEVMNQVQELADDLVATSNRNRETLTALIRAEVDKAVGRMGFVREDEIAALRRHLARVEGEIAELRDAQAAARSAATSPAATPHERQMPDSAEIVEDSVVEQVLVEEAVIGEVAAQQVTDSEAPVVKKKIYLEPQEDQ